MKILYIASKNGAHHTKILSKISQDFEVLAFFRDTPSDIKGVRCYHKKSISYPFNEVKQIYKDFKPDLTHIAYLWQTGVLAEGKCLAMSLGSDILVDGKSEKIKGINEEVLEKSAHVLVTSTHIKKVIIDSYSIPETKITVNPLGVDLNVFYPINKKECRRKLNLPEDEFIVFHNRGTRWVYNESAVIKGFNLFGKGLLINRNDIPYAELHLWYNSADVWVTMSLSDGPAITMLEAMACGCGVVASNVPSRKEWIDDCPVSDFEALAIGLNCYYRDREMLKEHGERNIRVVTEHGDWNKNYLKLKKIYYGIGDIQEVTAH